MTGDEWQALDLHRNTVSTLLRYDWVQEAPGPGGMAYRITKRGRDAHALFASPVGNRRWDGMCPMCGERPKHNSWGYCQPCAQSRNKRNYLQNGEAWRRAGAGKLCPECGKRPRHVTGSGSVRPYCTECARRRNKLERQRRVANLLARVQAGEYVPCCRCDQPVYHSANSVYDYCYDHYREYQRQSRVRRHWRKAVRGA